MIYIHQTSCISPQTSLPQDDETRLAGPVEGVYKVIEPAYAGIPANVLRRMSKAVRMGVGAALPLLAQTGVPDGILIGTGNGGMEESVKFLRQIIDYSEGLLAPGNFVQSIPNAIASQIGLSNHNRGYNTTFVHRGFSFENALIDAAMLARENSGGRYLVGGVDELSGYHYRIEQADGWYRGTLAPGLRLYDYDSPGTIAGEGAALFQVSDEATQAQAAIRGIATLHSRDGLAVAARLRSFLEQYLPPGRSIDLFLSGENGDSRLLPIIAGCEAALDPAVPIARFKHLCGEYPTASAFAVWLSLQLGSSLPQHMVKRPGAITGLRYILLYNNHKLVQHSFMLIERFR
ncbi:MAG TPA: beta-ketoacyl synthase chain length factor [Puia sp.]|nr:beta-ketoacyl synthase chain length factor [Puia sp.]